MSNIATYTKKFFDPAEAEMKDIDIVDIAHALSMLCRANGHFSSFYSVAQHSLNCLLEAKARGYSKRVQFGCLLHDASEAYLSDITRPIKSRLSEYRAIEEKLQNTIFDKWITPTLNEEERKLVFEIDDAILYYEFITLMGEKLFDKAPLLTSNPKFEFEDFKKVENQFVDEFNKLVNF